jgi:predicted nuclease of restriction endonuclease-like RecB superfamily
MLTTDLVRMRRKGMALEPQFIDPERADLRELTEVLRALVERAVADRSSRGTLERALDEAIGHHRSRRLMEGLVRLLLDGVTFAVDAPAPPATVRARAFALAAERGPLALPGDPLGRVTADDVLAEVARELDTTVDAVARSLYADLRDAEVATEAKLPSAAALLARYNMANVQGMLLRATELRVVLARPTVGRVRQLLRWLKFFQLMHRARRDDGELELIVDGPTSIFGPSTRYGLNLANLLPAIVLQPGPWMLEARIQWDRADLVRTLTLTDASGLQSHLPDTGAWVTPEQRMFEERWAALGDTGWEMTADTTPMALADEGVLLPDFTFRKDGRVAHLEIVGYWRKGWLAGRLQGLTRHGPGNVVFAISTRLAVDEADLDALPGEVLRFAQVVPAKAVLEAVERIAR